MSTHSTFIQHDLTVKPTCWRFDLPGNRQTLVLAAWPDRLPEVMYCGLPLPASENLVTLAQSRVRPITPGTLDETPPLSLMPEEGMGFPGHHGMRLFDAEGRPAITQFHVVDTTTSTDDLKFHCHDEHNHLDLIIRLHNPADTHLLQLSTELHNVGDTTWRVDWLSIPVIPVAEEFTDVLEFFGRWTQEFNTQRVNIQHGLHVRENRKGRSGFDGFPGMIMVNEQTAYTSGPAAAVTYVKTGLHRMIVEALPDGRQQLQAGIPEARLLHPGKSVHSGSALWGFSATGLNSIANDMQTHVRRHLVRRPNPDSPRPIHYNSWEAVYFHHDVDTLKKMASLAADVGAERFVLDDGWFGTDEFSRDDDTTSLGDWYIDKRKYPEGLTPLIDHVLSIGMTFGIWVEPEMVNLNSSLARQHPDWVMRHGSARQIEWRQQQVLDITRSEVADYLFERLDELLAHHSIDYIKWDMNRDLTHAVDQHGKPLLVAYADAYLALVERVRQAHPTVEIEMCSSGGSRTDYQALQHHHRMWLSDSHDSLERWRAQNAAFLFLPPEIIGSHIGADINHTSGRQLSMPFRALVATSGNMGIEADLRALCDDDRAVVRRYTDFYKKHRHWLHQSFQYRLDAPVSHTISQLRVARDGAHFLLFAGTQTVPATESTPAVKLTGLEPEATYRVKLVNTEDISPLATRYFGSPYLEEEGLVLSGASLMQAGLITPFPFPASMWLFEGERI